MALSKISELGGVILGNYDDEMILPALGDGTTKAGMAVYINTAGQAVATDVNVTDIFLGFALPAKDIDLDTAITAGKQMNVVVPKAGHLYGTFIVDLNLGGAGLGLIPTTTAGSLGTVTDVEAHVMAYTYTYNDGDTVGIIIYQG